MQRILQFLVLLAALATASAQAAEPPAALPAAPSPTAPFDYVAERTAARDAEVKACYAAASPVNPHTSGDIRVTFTLGTHAAITRVKVAGAGGAFKGCVISVFKHVHGLPFVAAPLTMTVTYKFTKP